MDIRKHWDQWGWIVVAIPIILGFGGLILGREPFCGARMTIAFANGFPPLAASPQLSSAHCRQYCSGDKYKLRGNTILRIDVTLYELPLHSLKTSFSWKNTWG